MEWDITIKFNKLSTVSDHKQLLRWIDKTSFHILYFSVKDLTRPRMGQAERERRESVQ
jgi:hypothetical protein